MPTTQILLPRLDRGPTEAELFPFLEQVDVCIYCGRPQTDEQAEHRTTEHITEDLLAIHRHDAALRRTFGAPHPGYEDDVYDLLCELDAAEQDATGDCPLDGPCSICATLTPAARAALAEGLVTEAVAR